MAVNKKLRVTRNKLAEFIKDNDTLIQFEKLFLSADEGGAVLWDDLIGILPVPVPDTVLWDDLRVPSQNTKLNPTKTEPAFESFIGGVFVYKFDTTNADDESVHFIAQMPHSYKEGTDLEPHIHWSPDSTNTGDVHWSFEYTIANINGTFSTTVTDDITVAADGTALGHQVESFTAIPGTGLTISHILVCRLTRRSTTQADDTFTGNACFLEFDFHFEKDSVGSLNEFSN